METDPLSRRNALRGALAVGCGLCLPVALFGCDAKKSATEPTGTAPSAPPAKPSVSGTVSPAPAPAPAPAAAVKATKTSTQYQAQPKGEQKCSACTYFMAESGTCKLVEGEISPEGWCVLYVKKA
jgi:hypothetical protein